MLLAIVEHKEPKASPSTAPTFSPTDRLTRETGYTALSRGRHDNHLYAVASPAFEHDHGHLTRPDPLIDLRRDLQRSNAQHLDVDDHSAGIEL